MAKIKLSENRVQNNYIYFKHRGCNEEHDRNRIKYLQRYFCNAQELRLAVQLHAQTRPVQVQVPQQSSQGMDALSLGEVDCGSDEYCAFCLRAVGRFVGKRESVDATFAGFET